MFNRKKTQFLHLCRDVNKLHENGRWPDLSLEKKESIRKKIHHLYLQVKAFLNRSELRRVAATLAFVLGLSIAASAQTFGPVQTNPFGLSPNESGLNLALFADIDSDGDFDIIGTTYSFVSDTVYFFFTENTGTAKSPQFIQPVFSPFGLQITSDGLIAITDIVDLDNDGDLDILYISGEYYPPSIYFIENMGSKANPSFDNPVINPFGLGTVDGNFALPSGDIDDDGDFDLIYFGYYGNKFYENTGTASSPAFASPVTGKFGLVDNNPYIIHAALSDIDRDGDLDIIAVDIDSLSIMYYNNTGTKSSAQFAPPVANPFGLSGFTDSYYLVSVSVADLDDDGDPDMLISDFQYDYSTYSYSANYLYFENTSPAGISSLERSADKLVLFPQPCSDEVHVDLRNANGNDFSVRITDLNGNEISSQDIQGAKTHTLPVSDLASGMYFIEVTGDTYFATAKMVKQ